MGLAEAFKFYTGQNVLDSALSRYEYMFRTGHVVISFSGGKDSGILVELGLMAKEMYGFSQPLHVVMRDEERQTLMKESQVIRLIYVYTGDQAKIIKKTLGGDDPADKLFQIVNQYYQANKAEIDKQ
jgi:predicted phosphoadenosine phosphosulfate sulfurtransferase